MTDYERSQLADALMVQAVSAGTNVVNQGDEGTRFFIVESGNLKAMKSEAGGAAKEVLTYKAGDFFGELALMGEATPRAATVVAVADSKLLWVDRTTFRSFLGPLEEFLAKAGSKYA